MIEVVIKRKNGAECGRFEITDSNDVLVFERGVAVEFYGGADAVGRQHRMDACRPCGGGDPLLRRRVPGRR